MQDLYREGRIKAIGVSNFHPDRLVDLIDNNDVTPAVNQIETHPLLPADDRPEDHARAWRRDRIVGSVRRRPQQPVHRPDPQRDRRQVRQVRATGRAPPAHPARCHPDPKSVRPDRMAQNLDVFAFELTDDQMARIATMDTGSSQFFDHRDSAMVRRLGQIRVND
jgi:2,5-diketo-D-gluconate reductase A